MPKILFYIMSGNKSKPVLTLRAILLKSIDMQLFGTSGVRRLVSADLLYLSLKIGMAVGLCYKNVVVGRDTRTSGSAMHQAVAAGLLASGAQASDAGIVPTPTLAFSARNFDAGIMITASHNPPQYNGLKLLNPDGSAFSLNQQAQVQSLVEDKKPLDLNWENMQSGTVYNTAVESHIARILKEFPDTLRLKVVVDSGCGAAYFITAELLRRLGCDVISLNVDPKGVFPHDIEPIEANLGQLIMAVRSSRADLGIAHDGDADRMMAIDDLGRFISGDKMLAILSKASGAQEIVTTIDASIAIEEIGLVIRRTKVGDPYVSEELKNWGGFGGEPSGAWVFPQISLCPDGIFAAAEIVNIASKQRLSLLVDALPSYPVIRGSVSGIIDDISGLNRRLLAELKPVSSQTTDGIKLNLDSGALLVRPSGTEPKIRITAESKEQASALRLYDTGARIIAEYLRGGKP